MVKRIKEKQPLKLIMRTVIALILASVLMLTGLAATPTSIQATLSPDVTIKYNGEMQTLRDGAGGIVYPILYQGTTYVPLRGVSTILGVAVSWDGATRTVKLGGDNPPPPPAATAPGTAAPAPSSVKATLSPDVTIEYNGAKKALLDGNGNEVYPILYQGTTYVPLRGVSTILGVGVTWDGATRTVLLGENQTPTPPAPPSPGGSTQPPTGGANIPLSTTGLPQTDEGPHKSGYKMPNAERGGTSKLTLTVPSGHDAVEFLIFMPDQTNDNWLYGVRVKNETTGEILEDNEWVTGWAWFRFFFPIKAGNVISISFYVPGDEDAVVSIKDAWVLDVEFHSEY